MVDDLTKFLDNPALRAALQMAALLFARLMPIVTLTPVFGGQLLPRRLRMGLTFVFTAALLPVFLTTFQTPIAPFKFAALLAKEAVVGLTLAFFVLVVFEAIAAMGALVDLSRGATMANVLDPLTQNQQSILAVFFTQIAIVLFLSIGGIQLLISAIGDGFVILPPQQLVPASVVGPNATETPIALVSDLFGIAFRLGAPVVAVLLLLDFGLGIVNRVASQVQVYFLGMTLKGAVGILIVLLGLAMTFDLITGRFAGMLQAMKVWTKGAAP